MQSLETVQADSEFDGVSQVASHGSGRCLKALADLPLGTRVARFEGPIVPFSKVPSSEFNHALGLRGGKWLVPSTNARFVNHSCAANCEVWDDLTVVTIKPVRRGEELTISYNLAELTDYRSAPEEYAWDPRWSFDCLCGADICSGRIDGYKIVPDISEAACIERESPVKRVVGSTPGKGRAVFAKLPYESGELVEECPVIIIPPEQWRHIEQTSLFDYSFTFGPDGEHAAIALGMGSIYNHSYKPNAEYATDWEPPRIRITAIRPIRPGEEITINYNRDPFDETPVWFDVKD